MDTKFNSTIAQADFLSLLTTQLRFQDPMEPVDQEAFTGQLSQFSMLQGMEKLNTSFDQMLKLQQITQGMDLVGKTVTWQDSISGNLKSGRVDAVTLNNNQIIASVGGQPVSISQIAAVGA